MGAFQAFLELVTRHELSAVLAGERRSVHREEHGDGRRVDMDAGEVLRVVRRADGIADIERVEACNQDDVARTGFVNRLRGKAFVAENLLRADGLDASVGEGLRVSLVGLERSLLDASHGKAAEERGVFEGGNLEERLAIRVALRGRDALDDLVHEDAEVAIRVFHLGAADALAAATEHLVEVELFFARVEFAEQVEHLVESALRVAAVAVDLVHHDNRGKPEFKCLLGHKARLGHGAFERVNNQKHTVNRAEHAFHLATEVGVPRGIDDVHAIALVHDARVLGEDGDAAFAFKVVGVHHALVDFFTFVEGSALLEKLVHQGRFTVVDVGDDGYVSDFCLIHIALLERKRSIWAQFRNFTPILQYQEGLDFLPWLESEADLAHIDAFFVLSGVVAAFFGPCGEFEREHVEYFDSGTGTGVAALEACRDAAGKSPYLVVQSGPGQKHLLHFETEVEVVQELVVVVGIEGVGKVAGDVELARVGRVHVEESGAVVHAHREVRRYLVSGQFLEVYVAEREAHAKLAGCLPQRTEIHADGNRFRVEDVAAGFGDPINQRVVDGSVVADVHDDHFDLLALGSLDADTDRELVGEVVGDTALHDGVHVERIDGEVGEHNACVDVGGYVSVNPDGSAEVVEREFRIHLELHGDGLVVVAVERVDELGVRGERIEQQVGLRYSGLLGGLAHAVVHGLQVAGVLVRGDVGFERTGTADIDSHVEVVARVVSLFGSFLVVTQAVDLREARVVEVDGFLVVYDGDVGVTHGFGADGMVRRGFCCEGCCGED